MNGHGVVMTFTNQAIAATTDDDDEDVLFVTIMALYLPCQLQLDRSY